MDTKRSAPIQFRSVELEPELAKRQSHLYATPGHVARRDLERYYHLLAAELRQVRLTEAEACLICDALNGTIMIDSGSISMLWAEIDDAIRLDGLDTKWGVTRESYGFHGSSEDTIHPFVNKLRNLTATQTAAVVDAVERWWSRDDLNERPLSETLCEVGLIKPEAKNGYPG